MQLASDVADPDAALWVRFYKKPVQNNFRSKQEGHPCFDEKTFVSIIAPGDPNNKVDRPVMESDKDRFHKQWRNFERNDGDKIEGSAIEEWPQITRAQAEELKFLGIRSIEQLCAASDNQMQKFMGGVSLRERAKAFLATAKNSAEAQRIADDNLSLRNEVQALKEQVARLSAKVQQETETDQQPVSAIPKRRGRPPRLSPGDTQ